MVKQLIVSVVILGCMLGYGRNYVYAKSMNEAMVESYVKVMEDIECYEAQLQKQTIDNKGYEQEKKRWQKKLECSQRKLDNFLEQKEKELEEIRKLNVGKAYLKSKETYWDFNETELKRKIIEIQNKAKNALRAYRVSYEDRSLKEKNRLKQEISVSQKQLQGIADEYSRYNADARNILDAVSKLDQAQNDAGMIQAEIPLDSSEQKLTEYFTVFGIPLNAPLTEVLEVLDKKEIHYCYFEPLYQTKDPKHLKEKLKAKLANLYTYWGQPFTKDLERIFDEKFRLYFIGGNNIFKYYLFSTSFNSYTICDRNKGLYPLYEQYYNTYNSQFELNCNNLPAEMKLHDINGMRILFASLNGEEPRSFLIFLNPSSRNLIPSLSKKYGEPKLYRPDTKSAYRFDKIKADLFAKHLEATFSNVEVRKANDPPYMDILLNTIIIKDVYSGIPNTFFAWDRHNISHYWKSFLLEWNNREVKILLDSYATINWIFSNSRSSTLISQAVDMQEIYYNQSALNYIYVPTIRKLRVMYEKLFFESEKVMKEFKNKAADEF